MKDNEFNEYEAEFLDSVRHAEQETMAAQIPNTPIATRETIMNYTQWMDPWNPLYNDDEYAKNTRYGEIIAFPQFLYQIGVFMYWPNVNPEYGILDHNYAGDNIRYGVPVKVGDTFHIKRSGMTIRDFTEEFGDDLRRFLYEPYLVEIFNQNDEFVGSFKMMLDLMIRMEPAKFDVSKLPYEDHYYTPEEWEYIESVFAGEEIRGANPRYWEDVKVGDKVTPTSIGPTTIWDMVAYTGALHEVPFVPSRRYRELRPQESVVDPATNIPHMILSWHLTQSIANLMGNPRPFHFGGSAAGQMMRFASNYAGDDGSVRNMNWRHLMRTPHGDCAFVCGNVIRKYIEDGCHLVDIECYMLNVCRGNLTEAALITIELPVRDPEANLESMCEEHVITKKFEMGDKVRIHAPEMCLPTGYPLDGAEGVIAPLYPWMVSDFNELKDYFTSVKITKCDVPLGLGDTLPIRSELLEKI